MSELAVPLTSAEANLLAECEVVIERGMGVFIDVGAALMSVRENRLYRAEFGDFDDYCRERWALSKDYANKLISSARVVELISNTKVSEINNDIPLPATERQTRELAPLLDDPDELREVWNEAVERTEGKPTAAAIREVRRERSDEPEPAPQAKFIEPPQSSEDDARRDAELDAEMEDTAVRFRRNFSSAMRRAAEIWSFDVDRVAEVYDADFAIEIDRTFIREMSAFCARIGEAHRARQRAGLRVVNGGRH